MLPDVALKHPGQHLPTINGNVTRTHTTQLNAFFQLNENKWKTLTAAHTYTHMLFCSLFLSLSSVG